MRIAAIMGSPHRGASYALTQRIEAELAARGGVEFGYIHLKDLHLEPCRGCFACFLKGKDSCPLEDDKRVIEERIEAADGVLFVSPVYSMHVSSLMKLFIDRFSYTFHRPRYFDKYALAVATTGAMGLKETLAYLRGVAICWGFRFVDRIGLAAPPRPLPLVKPQKDRTAEVAERFYRAIRERRPRRLGFVDHLMFHSMRALYQHLGGLDPVPYDFTYWKERGMFEPGRRYFVDARSSALVNLAARLTAAPVGGQVRKALATGGAPGRAGAG